MSTRPEQSLKNIAGEIQDEAYNYDSRILKSAALNKEQKQVFEQLKAEVYDYIINADEDKARLTNREDVIEHLWDKGLLENLDKDNPDNRNVFTGNEKAIDKYLLNKVLKSQDINPVHDIIGLDKEGNNNDKTVNFTDVIGKDRKQAVKNLVSNEIEGARKNLGDYAAAIRQEFGSFKGSGEGIKEALRPKHAKKHKDDKVGNPKEPKPSFDNQQDRPFTQRFKSGLSNTKQGIIDRIDFASRSTTGHPILIKSKSMQNILEKQQKQEITEGKAR